MKVSSLTHLTLFLTKKYALLSTVTSDSLTRAQRILTVDWSQNKVAVIRRNKLCTSYTSNLAAVCLG
jgi:hypothetical protein